MGENSGSSDQVITAPDTSTCSLLLHSTPADSMGHMGHTTDSPHLPCSVASLTATTSSTNTPTSVSSEQSSFILEPNFGQAALTHLSNTGNNTQQIITTTTGNNYSIVSSSSINSSSNQQLPVQVNQQQQVSSSPPVTSVTPVTYQFSPSSANCSTSGGNNTITGCIPVPQPPPVLPGHHHNISSASSTASSASGFNSISSNYNSNSTSNSSNNHHHHHHHHNNTSNSNNNNNNNNQNSNMHTTADYLAQLLKDQKQVSAFPGVFYQVERLLNEEINRVRSSLFQLNGSEKKPLKLPDPEGPNEMRQDKIYVPVDQHPDYNFVGRILGPRGMTAKQLEQETGCKIMVRGKGSMRDRKKEEQNRGKPNWEHLSEPLHVLITCEDTANRVDIKLSRAREEVEKLLVPVADGEDDLKKRQLMELAIINGTYRDSTSKPEFRCDFPSGFEPEQLKMLPAPILRHMGAPLIISPQQMLTQHQVLNGTGPQMMASPETAGLLYTRATAYDFATTQYAHNLLAAAPHHLLEFQPAANGTVADTLSSATPGKQRRPALTTNLREHPYQRPAKAT